MNLGKEAVLGLIRHMLTFGGGVLAANGVIAETSIEAAVGAIITLLGVVWSAWAPEKVEAVKTRAG